MEREDLDLERGIFQRDSLSPLLFCFSLILVTEQLNKLNVRYEEHTKKTTFYTYFTWMNLF
jgi:hypothetical protein